MKPGTRIFQCLILASALAAFCMDLEAATPAEQSAAALARRVLGSSAADLRFEQIQADQGRDVFELDEGNSQVIIRGNSGLSMAVGLNWYLKYYAQGSVSLNGRQISLPQPMPPVTKKLRMSGWAQVRYFLNYCTFSYSMSWWDWAQWERFIDWMALNGINQPLAVTGQEAVWQAIGRRFGMTDEEIDAFLAGPPYLPFSWMGCLDGHGGPLPKNWIPQHVELEKKILARERELGMTPVLQGFTGHVPEAILKKFPGTKAQRIHWIEFDTNMLDPLDPLFQKLGTAFIEEQTKLFGTDHLYAADSFIEMTPPNGDLNYLAGVGRAIYEGMANADPQAVWLLQGWTFMNQAQFWKQDRIKAFLDAVPNEHMLVLDLFCESTPVWNTTQGFYGKPWVWSFVHLFGDRTSLGNSGSLDRFNDLANARKDPLGRSIRGVGLMMEGFGHNPLIFDVMFELGWRDNIEIKSWVRDFSRFRYGKINVDAEAAWETLRSTIYSRSIDGQTFVTSFPSGGSRTHYPATALRNAFRQLLQAQTDLAKTETYRHDLVNIARQSLSNHASRLYTKTMAAYQAKDAAAYRQASAEFLQLITDLDELLATSDQFLLGSWLEDARRWGATEAERIRLEWNARRILTLWGTGAALRDYAWKEWSGFLTGFYRKRWEIFFQRQQEALEAGKPFDQVACNAELNRFENEWCQQIDRYPSMPKGDSISVAQRLFDKYMVDTTPTFRNLATGKSATCSFALPGMEAARANDGDVDTESYWGTDATKDSAAWWSVDLARPTKIGRVVVVAYYGDNRYYGFTVEGSLEDKTWEMIADRRDNTEPSTEAGYSCQFKPVEVRYLRVTMNGNSANTGRHLVEVMVFEK